MAHLWIASLKRKLTQPLGTCVEQENDIRSDRSILRDVKVVITIPAYLIKIWGAIENTCIHMEFQDQDRLCTVSILINRSNSIADKAVANVANIDWNKPPKRGKLSRHPRETKKLIQRRDTKATKHKLQLDFWNVLYSCASFLELIFGDDEHLNRRVLVNVTWLVGYCPLIGLRVSLLSLACNLSGATWMSLLIIPVWLLITGELFSLADSASIESERSIRSEADISIIPVCCLL
jgi:hypothetical protein